MHRKASSVRLFYIVTIFTLDIASPAQAQGQPPKAEIFGGYSYSSATHGGVRERENINGWGVDLSGNFGKHLGITADIGGQYGKAYSGQIAFRMYEFLFGPRLSWRTRTLTGFAHVLAGAAHTNAYDLPYKYFFLPYPSDTRFAMGFGGGVDITVSKRIAIRAPQFDYIPVRNRPYWTHNFRVQSGIVLRIGP